MTTNTSTNPIPSITGGISRSLDSYGKNLQGAKKTLYSIWRWTVRPMTITHGLIEIIATLAQKVLSKLSICEENENWKDIVGDAATSILLDAYCITHLTGTQSASQALREMFMTENQDEY